jgi:hypothetical protein
VSHAAVQLVREVVSSLKADRMTPEVIDSTPASVL